MKFINNIKSIGWLAILLIALNACNNKWDEHYAEENFDLPTNTIYEYLKTNDQLSKFVEMLDQTGYNQALESAQTYTVWAPTNDALASVALSDSVLVNQIVRTHITRNRYSASGNSLEEINVLSGKFVPFNYDGADYSFGENALLSADINTKNGLVHIINQYVPYQQNIWEFIHANDEMDSLSKFLNDKSELTFSYELSTEIGYSEDGDPIYDSVFVIQNEILDQLGAFNTEDSIYSVILPTDTAWNEAYDRISPYFVFSTNMGGESRRDEMSKFTIIKDFAYRQNITDPTSYSSLVTTSGTEYLNPSYLFEGTSYNELSNGKAYVTDLMPFSDTLSWFKEIRIEAEQEAYRENSNSNLYTRSSEGTSFETSNNNYVFVEATSTSNLAAPEVQFSIPNVLSAKYKIYCVFVPNTIVNESDLRPMVPTFTLTYIRSSSGRTSRRTLTPDVAETSPTDITKMYLGEFTFDYANVVDGDFEDMLITLTVRSGVRTSETADYSRDMRIDCIILEPSL